MVEPKKKKKNEAIARTSSAAECVRATLQGKRNKESFQEVFDKDG